jgi:hypothetical protein
MSCSQTRMKLSVHFEQRSGHLNRVKTPSLLWVGGSCTTPPRSTNSRLPLWVDPSTLLEISQSHR